MKALLLSFSSRAGIIRPTKGLTSSPTFQVLSSNANLIAKSYVTRHEYRIRILRVLQRAMPKLCHPLMASQK